MNKPVPAVSSTSKAKPADPPPGFFRRAMRGKRVWVLGLLFVIAAFILSRLYQSDLLTSEGLLEQERSIRQFIGDRPLISFCIGFLVYTILSCFPGLTGKSILFGWLFGLWSGLAIVSLALTIAAIFGFLLSRHLLREFVYRKFAFFVRRINQSFDRQGPIYLVLLRLIHVPYTPLNYALGATGISTRTFAWTTLVGMFPSNFAFVLAGSQLPTLEGVLEAGIWSLIDLRVLAAMSAAVLIPVVVRQLALPFRPSRAMSNESQPEDNSNGSGTEQALNRSCRP